MSLKSININYGFSLPNKNNNNHMFIKDLFLSKDRGRKQITNHLALLVEVVAKGLLPVRHKNHVKLRDQKNKSWTNKKKNI